MAFCILSGDSFKSFAMDGSEVFRIVESSICIKIAVAKMNGRILLVVVSNVLKVSGMKSVEQKVNLNGMSKLRKIVEKNSDKINQEVSMNCNV